MSLPCPSICRFYKCTINNFKEQASIATEYKYGFILDGNVTDRLLILERFEPSDIFPVKMDQEQYTLEVADIQSNYQSMLSIFCVTAFPRNIRIDWTTDTEFCGNIELDRAICTTFRACTLYVIIAVKLSNLKHSLHCTDHCINSSSTKEICHFLGAD